MKNLIKERNLNLIRRVLRMERRATKARLGELTGISVVTIHSLLTELLETGEVLEDEAVQPQLGRPAASYRFNELASVALVIDLYEPRVSNTTYFDVIDLYGNCIWQCQKELGEVSSASFYPVIDEVKERYPQLALIAFGAPGAVDGGRMVTSDYPELLEVDLAAVMKERYQTEVLVENDINAAVYGYCVLSGCLEDQTVVGLYIPEKYPPGAGICRDGEIIRGRNGFAGEIKHLPASPGKTDSAFETAGPEEFVRFAVRIFMSVLNPDRIVLYYEPGDGEFVRRLQEESAALMEGRLEPKILCQNSMAEDFRKGMIQLALGELLLQMAPG